MDFQSPPIKLIAFLMSEGIEGDKIRSSFSPDALRSIPAYPACPKLRGHEAKLLSLSGHFSW